MKTNKLLLSFIALLFFGNSFANNLKIENLNVTSTASETTATFNISWDNSWYFNTAPDNWDAVWVFFKSYDCEPVNKEWKHVDVKTSSSSHSTSGEIQVDAVPDGKGVFVRRNTAGTAGNITSTTVTVRFQGVYDVNTVNFKVMGIEMVAVLEGEFQVGGISGTWADGVPVHNYAFNTTTITSENSIAANALRISGGSGVSNHLLVPAEFPKGYNKFYIMKYPISQEQYASFLNLLTYAQQVTRTSSTPLVATNVNALAHASNATIYNRNGVKMMTPSTGTPFPAEYGCNLTNDSDFNLTNDGQNIACNFLSWEDLQAYLDWSALRPMTELEYEKAARGASAAVADEYVWGNTNITNASSTSLTDASQGSEISNASTGLTAGTGLSAYGNTGTATGDGPLRVGFAAMSGTDRIAAGASYWGVMDLSGNVYEQTMGVGYSGGNLQTSFTGLLGDGELNSTGGFDVIGWTNSYLNSSLRGGSWYSPDTYLRTGSRYQINQSINSARHREVGGRGVRQF